MQRRRLTGKQPPLNRPNPGQRRLTGKQPAGPRAYTAADFQRFVPPERLEQVRQIFQELNRPGVSRLKTALRARGINASDAEIGNVVRGDESKQLFAPRQRYEGRIASSNLNERWAADLIDYTAQPSPPLYAHPRSSAHLLAQNLRAAFAGHDSSRSHRGIPEHFIRSDGPQ